MEELVKRSPQKKHPYMRHIHLPTEETETRPYQTEQKLPDGNYRMAKCQSF